MVECFQGPSLPFCCCDGANHEQNYLHMHACQRQTRMLAFYIPRKVLHGWEAGRADARHEVSCCRNAAPAVVECAHYIYLISASFFCLSLRQVGVQTTRCWLRAREGATASHKTHTPSNRSSHSDPIYPVPSLLYSS
jgi:hypothetical protein